RRRAARGHGGSSASPPGRSEPAPGRRSPGSTRSGRRAGAGWPRDSGPRSVSHRAAGAARTGSPSTFPPIFGDAVPTALTFSRGGPRLSIARADDDPLVTGPAAMPGPPPQRHGGPEHQQTSGPEEEGARQGDLERQGFAEEVHPKEARQEGHRQKH